MTSRPQLLTTCQATHALIRDVRAAGLRVGLIPTMGALHEGHLSLVRAAQAHCDKTLVTIFVNPTQFGPQEDYSRYPRQLDTDLGMLACLDADYVFAPPSPEIYPAGFSTHVQPPLVARRWEGVCRPEHFPGVATVVLKLFLIAPAHRAYFGRKDYQQAQVIRHMVQDLNVPIEIQVEETVREADGLALSSRNRYLDAQQRAQAQAIPRAWRRAQQEYAGGLTDARRLESVMQETLREAGIHQVDYAAIVDPDSLEPVASATEHAVVLLAAYVGSTRLIDNVTLGHVPGEPT